MILKNVSEAKAQLSALVEEVLKGKEVLIGRGGKPEVKLVKYKVDERPRQAGALKGRIRIKDGFDELPPELERAFGVVKKR